VEADVEKVFPLARTLRWDWETTRQKDAHQIILSHFSAHRADILIGTQMLAKGLDLPLVTLVGIVLADVGLNLPDPFAAERVFQVLTQVAGRAGRSTRGGKVILQTFQPEHYVIRHASDHNYQAFYDQELAYRKALGYPPYTRLIRLEFRHHDADLARRTAKAMGESISERITKEERVETDVIGPAPCFFAKLAGQFRWQVVVRGPQPDAVLRAVKLDGWRVEVAPADLL
jgi:primosomal protein N' (replication factor Y)